jgi:hypothetical protein
VALAAAASVATIGIVTWIGGQGASPAPGPAVATTAGGTAGANIQPVNNTTVVTPVDTRFYEGIHRQVPSPDVYTVNNTRKQ